MDECFTDCIANQVGLESRQHYWNGCSISFLCPTEGTSSDHCIFLFQRLISLQNYHINLGNLDFNKNFIPSEGGQSPLPKWKEPWSDCPSRSASDYSKEVKWNTSLDYSNRTRRTILESLVRMTFHEWCAQVRCDVTRNCVNKLCRSSTKTLSDRVRRNGHAFFFTDFGLFVKKNSRSVRSCCEWVRLNSLLMV